METGNTADAEDSSYDSDYETEDLIAATSVHSQVDPQVTIFIKYSAVSKRSRAFCPDKKPPVKVTHSEVESEHLSITP